MKLFTEVRLCNEYIIFGGLEDIGEELVLGSDKVSLVWVDRVRGLGLLLTRL